MQQAGRSLGITDVVLRDAHQSLFATRLRLDDMLPIAEKLDAIGFWSLESWGGATFDACIRYLGEDPWERIRQLKRAMPKTRQQMLLRGQNLLGYRHYADDVVEKFVERAAKNGVDVFRVFDAMNDMRNIEVALAAVRQVGGHAQGTIAYTLSPVHDMDTWVEQGKRIEDMGADSIAIKDMAGLLTPYAGFELVSRLKSACDIPIHMQSHATTGMSTATILKCVEAGIDNVDTAISSMSMTYGHSATESVVAILQGTDRDTGLDLAALSDIAAYFREVRRKYAKFEGSLRGVDARILVAQVPGGMLTNMENQLREQNATDRMDAVLAEIPRVREDLGYIPLVTPTSQIVGSQAVMNVLTGERYQSVSRETAALLRGEYGATPAPVSSELLKRVLEDGEEPLRCRPADRLEPELDHLSSELREQASQRGIALAPDERELDDILSYALFPQVGLRFLENRGNPEAFEPPPGAQSASPARAPRGERAAGDSAVYTVAVDGQRYVVEVAPGGDLTQVGPGGADSGSDSLAEESATGDGTLPAPLAGTIVKLHVSRGDKLAAGDLVLILEAMKMETEVRATRAGEVAEICVKPGDAIAVGDPLIRVA